jgi:hypothetical protein
LKWGFFGSVAFIVGGAAIVVEDVDQIAIGLASIVLFSVSARAWAYALRIKLAQKAAEAATAEK